MPWLSSLVCKALPIIPSSYHTNLLISHLVLLITLSTNSVIDVLLRGVLEEIASIVIVLRLWRVFKIIEELSVSAEDQMEELKARLEELEHEKGEMQVELTRLRNLTGAQA